MTPHQRAVVEQDRYYSRKELGLCVKCKELAAPDHVHCWTCIRKNRARVAEYKLKHD